MEGGEGVGANKLLVAGPIFMLGLGLAVMEVKQCSRWPTYL